MMQEKINQLFKYFGLKKTVPPYVKPALRIFHTEYPKENIDFFKWAEHYKIGTATKNVAYEDKNLVK